jgi:nucleoid-associated protein YgaU
VKKGDTLWDISGKFLSKPWRWPEIWASNKHVKNPHWIYPGDRLLLCSLNGKP